MPPLRRVFIIPAADQGAVDAGTQVHATDTTGLVTITQIEPITVAFSVSQDVLADLAEAQQKAPLAVTVGAREGSKQLATGALVFIDSQVAPGTGQVVVKARFANRDLVVSQLLTLYTTPVIYLAFDRFAKREPGVLELPPALAGSEGRL